MHASFVLLVSLVAYSQASTSCTGRCGSAYDRNQPCQCNDLCPNYSNCCSDYNTLCLGQSPGSCQGRCGSNLDNSQSCQCNSHCKQFNDCCNDYDILCGGGDDGGTGSGGDVTALMEDLWASDVDRFAESEYELNYQSKTNDNDRVDRANSRLFTSLNEARFSRATYRTFILLLDNYNINVGQADDISATEWDEIENFLDEILATSVMQKAFTFLHTYGYVPKDPVEWRDILKEMWFNLYPRSSSKPVLDSSGFEHVLVGEEKSTSIGGFHNWIQFYLEEKAGRLDYTGWVSQALPRTVGSQFKWNGKWKGLGSFLVGVSPEFDVAIYTVCAILKPNSVCSFTLDGRAVSIQSYDIGHKSGIQLATAYVRA